MEGVDHLAHERNRSQFDVDAMKIVWAGSRHAFEVSDRMSRLVANDPVSNFFATRQIQTLYRLRFIIDALSLCLFLVFRPFERITGLNYQGRSCSRTRSEKQLMHGRRSLSLSLLVQLFHSISFYGKPWTVLIVFLLFL